MPDYYTVVIPYVDRLFSTMWHPTEKEGTMSSLTRGCFKTQTDAIRWAQRELNGTPYSILFVGEGEG